MANTERFAEQLEANGAQVWRTSDRKLSASILQALNSLDTLEKPPREILSYLELNIEDSDIMLVQALPEGESRTGLSQAALGICDTGTLAVVSSPTNPSSINFLVDYHLLLIRESDLVDNLEQAMTALSQSEAWNARAVHFISGPSRTADIEQTIQLGAHGPRHLLVFIITSD